MNRRAGQLARLGLCLCLPLACRFAVEDIAQVPANPSYAQDIAPIYRDHCVLCHSSPSNHGAPTYFRLDRFDDSTVDGRSVAGAASMASTCARRITEGSMPPAANWGDGVGPRASEAVRRWSLSLNP